MTNDERSPNAQNSNGRSNEFSFWNSLAFKAFLQRLAQLAQTLTDLNLAVTVALPHSLTRLLLQLLAFSPPPGQARRTVPRWLRLRRSVELADMAVPAPGRRL